MKLGSQQILDALKETADLLIWEDGYVEILLIGGAAAMLTGELPSERITQDCDIMYYEPEYSCNAVTEAAVKVAKKRGLPDNWLNSQSMGLNVLPDGWRSRRIKIGQFSKLVVYAASRIDLLAMKFYANRPQDREDIINMKPTVFEMEYIGKYLNMLKLPRRNSDLDQVANAFELLDAMREIFND